MPPPGDPTMDPRRPHRSQGHTATAMTKAIFVHYYARTALPRECGSVVIVVAWAMFFFQVFFVLCTRNHYTVDVVVASYVAPLSFLANHYFFPTDVAPEIGLPRGEAQRDTDCGVELSNSV